MYYVKLTDKQQELLDKINKYIKRHFESLLEDDIFDEDELLADRSLDFVFSGSSDVFQLTSATAGILADLYPMLVDPRSAVVWDSRAARYTITTPTVEWFPPVMVTFSLPNFVKLMFDEDLLSFRRKPGSWVSRVLDCDSRGWRVHGRPARRIKQK